MSKNINNLQSSKPNKKSISKLISVSDSIEKSVSKFKTSKNNKATGSKKRITVEDSLINDSFIKEDKGEGQIKPIMEKILQSTATNVKTKISANTSEKINRKPIKINLIPNTSTINSIIKTPRAAETSPPTLSSKATAGRIFHTPLSRQQQDIFTEANKFLKTSNNKTEKSIQIVEKVSFKSFRKLYNLKYNNIYLVLQYLSQTEVKNLMKSFKAMKILIENSLLEKTYPIIKSLKKALSPEYLQFIRRRLVFYKQKGKVNF
jgi:hypothetical protein